jgi:hypothetical protein
MGSDRECAFCHRNYLHHKSETQGITQPRPKRHPQSHNEVLAYEEAPAWPPKPQHMKDIDREFKTAQLLRSLVARKAEPCSIKIRGLSRSQVNVEWDAIERGRNDWSNQSKTTQRM